MKTASLFERPVSRRTDLREKSDIARLPWLKGGFLPDFMALMLKTDYFLALVAFNRVGGVKQRMYYANLAEIRLPEIPENVQRDFARRLLEILANINAANGKYQGYF